MCRSGVISRPRDRPIAPSTLLSWLCESGPWIWSELICLVNGVPCRHVTSFSSCSAGHIAGPGLGCKTMVSVDSHAGNLGRMQRWRETCPEIAWDVKTGMEGVRVCAFMTAVPCCKCGGFCSFSWFLDWCCYATTFQTLRCCRYLRQPLLQSYLAYFKYCKTYIWEMGNLEDSSCNSAT